MKILLNMDVPELRPAIDFYSRALGLRHSRTLDDDVAELTGAAATLYLLKNAAGSPVARGTDAVRQYSRHWTPVHIDFVVDDLAVAAQRALAAGALQESACVRWRGSQCITFSDPFGHGFCLIEFAGDSYADV